MAKMSYVDFFYEKKTIPLWKMGGLTRKSKETLKEDASKSTEKRDHGIWEQTMWGKKWS